MQFFPNIARNSFGAEIWGAGKGEGGTWGKKGKKKKKTPANCTKPFPEKAQALGWLGHVAPSRTPLSAGFAVEAPIGVHPILAWKSCLGGENGCVWICVCAYIDRYIIGYIRKFSLCINIKHWYPNMTPQLTKVLDGSWACVSL